MDRLRAEEKQQLVLDRLLIVLKGAVSRNPRMV